MKAVYLHAESFSIIQSERQTVGETGEVGEHSSMHYILRAIHTSATTMQLTEISNAKMDGNGTTANSCIDQQLRARTRSGPLFESGLVPPNSKHRPNVL